MALIKCKECGKKISDKAINCPNCGAPINKNEFSQELSVAKRVAIFVIVILVIFLIVKFITGYFIPAHTYRTLTDNGYVEEFRLF